MKKNVKNILLINDDGVRSEGLMLAAKVLREFGNVYIVVPDKNRSGSGHSITLFWPIVFRPFQSIESCFECSGTPADCTKLGIKEIMKETKPDLVVVGINPGENTGVSVLYSGTVAAASESTIIGVPAIAISISTFKPKHYETAVDILKKVVPKILVNGLPDWTILNINVPDIPKADVKGIKIVPQGFTYYDSYIQQFVDGHGNSYHWPIGEVASRDERQDYDAAAVKDGYIAISPIKVDRTAYEFIDELKNWGL